VTGQLFASFAVIPLPARPDVSNLTAYASSSKLTRYFCPCCGASVANFEEAEWELATGIVEPLTRTDAAGETGGLLNRVLLCLSDTADGGVALWLDKRRLKFMTDRGKREANVAEVMEMSKKSREELARPSSSAAESDAENWLRARCHCGSTKFQISRSSSHDRYPAMLDGCTSCRTAEGFEITSWTRVPLTKLHAIDGSPLDLTKAGLVGYSSSPGVTRWFCSTCGATVFFHKEKTETAGVGVGLLEAGGARAEGWLKWEKSEQKSIFFGGEALDGAFVQELEIGMKEDDGV